MTDKYKNLLKEVGLDESDIELENMIQEIAEDPANYGQVEPPAGYETHLLSALREQLPLDNVAMAASSTESSTSQSWMAGIFATIVASRGLAWSVSGAMAVFIAFLSFQSVQVFDEPSMSDDFLVQTAQKGDSQAVARWVASVADLGVQLQTGGTNALAEDLAENPELAEEALGDVAASLGYKGDI